jgi:hypothetical protein
MCPATVMVVEYLAATNSSLYTGTPVVGNWLKMMESEHCERADSLVSFHTSNNGITTTRDSTLAFTAEFLFAHDYVYIPWQFYY